MNSEADFLGALSTQLMRSDLAYKAYFKSEKQFLYARVLKKCNDSMRMLLLDNAHLLPLSQSENAVALLHHIDVWSEIWEDTVEREKPTIRSIFTFENAVNFPRTQVDELMDYFEKIRG